MPNPDFDRRIGFDAKRQTMEADFSGFHFDSSARVNAFYDRIEERIAGTGEDQWFFLVNLRDMRIDPEAWLAYSRRGRALNHAHSMGTVRYDASEETRARIVQDANSEAFDPNLFADRDAALARIAEMPSRRVAPQARLVPTYTPADFLRRVRFDEAAGIMHVDLSHVVFNHSRDVDDFFDFVESRVAETGRMWFFLIDLNGCQILPAAWVQYAVRGRRLNRAASLGSVRYAVGSETEADIRLRAESQGFEPNIRNTRAEALARIEEMRRQHRDESARLRT